MFLCVHFVFVFYRVQDINAYRTIFFLFDLMHCSRLYPGMFKVSWFIWITHVSHKPLHMN